MSRKIFVTTALPYANGPFHIGHIMEYIQADIWVRCQRMQGNQVHFVCADDAHGAPIMLKAESEGVTPQQLIARLLAGRPKYLQGFHLSFDHWYTTDSPENTQLSQDIYARLKAAGLMYQKPVEQFYDPVKGMFLADRGELRLSDWDISRDAPYFGIPIPDAPGKYFYVWLDAPIGYLASLKNYFALGKARANGEPRGFEEFLAAADTEQIHFIGKD